MFKKLLSIILSLAILASCAPKNEIPVEGPAMESSIEELAIKPFDPLSVDLSSLNNDEILTAIEQGAYATLLNDIDSDEYIIENISATYISQEYFEELEFNSQENIYFGYSLSDLYDYFGESKFIFTCGDNGKTAVKEFENYDDTFDKVVRNFATGAGVILLCVTISAVSSGVGAPAISSIFAFSAKEATKIAITNSIVSGGFSGIVTAFKTNDFDEAMKSALLEASVGFKWGAIFGAVSGGLEQYKGLKSAASEFLSISEVATIQKESKLPLSFIKNIRSYDEYLVYKNAGLKAATVNGNFALVTDIDLNYLDPDGLSNCQRMNLGKAALDKQGLSYELHHIGQKSNSPLAILTSEQHKSNYSILHDITSPSEIDRNAFSIERSNFWKALAAQCQP